VIAIAEKQGAIAWVGAADSDHHLAVAAWFQRGAQGRSVDSLIQAFENAFAALWQRSYLVLGEVTLMAIVERVLHTATERFPLLASFEVAATGLRCESLRSQAGLRDDQVSAAIQFVLVEFLTVLGNLTAEILTPALHAELSKGHANVADGGSKDPAP
jgi:hypothetical protein